MQTCKTQQIQSLNQILYIVENPHYYRVVEISTCTNLLRSTGKTLIPLSTAHELQRFNDSESSCEIYPVCHNPNAMSQGPLH